MLFWDQYVVKFFAVLNIVALVFIIAYILDLIVGRFSGGRIGDRIWRFFARRNVTFVFVLSLASMIGSLTFSEVLHYTPCTLCWFQRIFMYPIVFLSGLALFKRDKKIMPYLFLLSIIGLLLAGFHYLGQISSSGISLPCSALGYSESCSDSFFKEFGFITIPFMAFTAFLGIILLHVNSRFRRNF